MSWGSEYEAEQEREESMKTHKMKPILFSGPMVRAILAGQKTVTRRVIKPQPKMRLSYRCMGYGHGKWAYPSEDIHKYWGDEWKRPDGITVDDEKMYWTPPCNGDDILYVRETWMGLPIYEQGPFPPQQRPIIGYEYLYKADEAHPNPDDKWRPSIFMPREAARIHLRVTNVRAERLNSIRDVDVIAEGIDRTVNRTMGQRRLAFADLWNSLNAKRDGGAYVWAKNPWVWVIEFERVADMGKGGLTI